ncbi:Helicase conserved C-terminal domain protein [Polymorphum gilvum SL003B-26A1]|uniref:Helicase conserved C-terminal domain protein n=1 Tax=Polymorphum gilvum (strain LMG 25793 / CGMCC 1.9160 / SL003B-26A1) TaxID=991905 RepID=F2J275_POLGS|nr:Helicase conserved C-terminal domain protein [Polymorphum gilvum SL003B-26A1]
MTAVLGPTNTGKTHLAIERMIAQPSGLIGLPLRLLAREVYGRLVARAGEAAVALITGEEKIIPAAPRFWVSTVEAMPLDLDTEFVAIDEVQLAGDLERGHVFTNRILNLRGRSETLLLGAATARPLLEKLIPGLNVVTRPRMSVLSYSGSKKISRLPTRSAVVAFSSGEVYAIAELIRRQRGGAAVVLGSLSPRTRNAQVELFQNGDVDYLVATDAIGMGLNLDVDHIAFAGNRKFDGYQYRALSPAEMGQIAGRAGRHTRDGSFGVTGRVDPLADDLVETIESHRFDALKVFQWRNSLLDFSSLAALRNALDLPPREDGLTRAPPGDDIMALDHAARDDEIRALATTPARIELLWDVCQVPDYRKIAPANHADLLTHLYTHLVRHGAIDEDWFQRQLAFADRTDGDIDTLANRIAHIRTWTFVANRADWLKDPAHWQGVTRGIEDKLSDALHDRLTQRFVDRRTSVLMRRLRENAMLEAEITPSGDVLVEGQHIGHLQGFRFAPDAAADGPEGKAVRAAAQKALASEIESRADRLSRAGNEDFILATDGTLRWQGEPVARLTAGDTALTPHFLLLADDQLTGPAREKVQARIDLWIKAHVGTLLKPLEDLRQAEGLEGLARGVAYRIYEQLGILERQEAANEVRQLDQGMRASLRKLGVRFGAYNIYIPALLKPAPSQLLAQLWALKHGTPDMPGLAELPQLSASGRTSIPVDPQIDKALYKVVGFRVCGPRAVRIDILERLADLIRPLIAWKPLDKEVAPPDGAIAQGGGFTVTVAMTSLLGCAGEDFSAILKSLGYRLERREVDLPPAPAVVPVAEAGAAGESGTEAAPATDDAPAPTQADADAGTAKTEAQAATEPAADLADASELAAADEPTASGQPEPQAQGETEASTTVVIEIWRPGRPERPGRSQGDGEQRGERKGRGDKRPHGPRRGKDTQGGEHRKEADQRHKSSGPDRREERRNAGKPAGQRDKAPRRDKPVDPDSPFAALMALKASMEKGEK